MKKTIIVSALTTLFIHWLVPTFVIWLALWLAVGWFCYSVCCESEYANTPICRAIALVWPPSALFAILLDKDDRAILLGKIKKFIPSFKMPKFRCPISWNNND